MCVLSTFLFYHNHKYLYPHKLGNFICIGRCEDLYMKSIRIKQQKEIYLAAYLIFPMAVVLRKWVWILWYSGQIDWIVAFSSTTMHDKFAHDCREHLQRDQRINNSPMQNLWCSINQTHLIWNNWGFTLMSTAALWLILLCFVRAMVRNEKVSLFCICQVL